MWSDLLQAFSLVVLLGIFSKIASPLGAAFYALIAITVRIPYLGKFFNWFLNKPVKLILIPKLIGWCISSSSILFGYLIYTFIFDGATEWYEYWIILIMAISLVINITHDLISFNIDTYSEYLLPSRDMYNFFFKDDAFDYHLSDYNNQMSLSRSLFVDLYLPQLFRLLFAVAFIYFSMSGLGYLQIKNNEPILLIDSIKTSFSAIPLINVSDSFFTGNTWNILDAISKFIIFLWGVFFIAGAQSMFSDEALIKDQVPTRDELLKKQVHSIIGDLKKDVLLKKKIDVDDKKRGSDV